MPFALFSPRNPAARHSPCHSSLRRAAGLGLGLLSLLSFSAGQTAHAGTVKWDGTAADWFSSPLHWVGGMAPGMTDDAVNNTTAAMTLGQTTTINSFFSNGAFSLTGGTFSGNQANSLSTITVNNVFTDNGGGISNFTVNQGMGGSVVFGTSGGNVANSDIFNANVDMSASSAYLRIDNTNTFNGNVALGASGGDGLHLSSGLSNFVLNGTLSGFGSVVQDAGGATFTNNGTVNANSSGNTLLINTDNYKNAGTTEATNGGTLTLASNVTTTDSGKITADGANSIVSIAGALTGSGSNLFTASNGGQIQINGASVLGTINEASGTALVFNTSGYNILNNTTINGNLDLSSPSAYLRLDNVDTINGNVALGASGGDGLHLSSGNSNFVLNGTLSGFGSVVQDAGGATFTNNGTVNANSSGNTLLINTDNYKNAGTTEATNNGTLTLAGNVTTTNTGLLSANTGGILNISGLLNSNTGNSINSVGGTVNILGATLLGTVNETAGSTLVFNTSGYNVLNNTTVNGNLDLSSPSAYLRLDNVDTINGNVALGAGGGDGLHLSSGLSNFVLNGTLSGFGSVVQDAGGATFTNNGTVNANSSGNTLLINTDNYKNAGTTEATNNGTLTLAGNVTTTNTGLLSANTGGILNISGLLNSNTGNSINSVGGTVNILGATLLGTVNETAGSTLVFNTSGYNVLNNTTISGNLDLATDSSAYLRLDNVDTINGNIALGATSADGLHLSNGLSNFVLNGTLSGFGSVVQDAGGATFTNNGTVNATGVGLLINTDNFNNVGTTKAANGSTVTLAGNVTTTDSGKITADGANSVVSIAGKLIGSGSNLLTATNGGQIQINGATLLGTINTDPNTALVFSTSGANILSNTTINGNLDLSSPSAYLRLDNVDTINGNVALGASGGDGLHLSNSNFVLNGTLSGLGDVRQDQGGATVTNNGTVNATGGTLFINTDNLVNTGTLEAQNGATLTTAANVTLTDSGNILVKSGGTATFGQPVTQTAGLTQVDGTLNSPLTLTGGTLKGTGTINGAVVNTGGTVAAGDSPGTLTVNGAFSQGAGGTLNAQFDNSGSSVLNVKGAVTTGGILDVNYIGTGAYTVGGPFTFLDYGTLGTEPTTLLGLNQYFSNETVLTNTTGLITGHNGFTYELINNTGLSALQLQVLTSGAPVPEASTTVSLGLLLALGAGGAAFAGKRKKAGAAV